MKQSESIKNLAMALMLFHVKIGKIAKSSTNPFFKSKYAGLPSVLDAITIPLQESNLTFTQFPNEDGLCTTLIHTESGEYMQSSFKMLPVKQDPQAQGSAITYARRYSLVSILGLNVDDDDDGNKASGLLPEIQQEKSAQPTKEWLNPNTELWKTAVKAIKDKKRTIEDIKKKYSISKTNQELLMKESN